jgi:hypothetical protein
VAALDESAGGRDVNAAISETAARPKASSRARLVGVLGAVVVVAASVGLFFVSQGKWSDAIVDSGSEWIFPDALARGDLLYRDVVYWFGPFTPYFHAAFFRLLGSSFRTLVFAGLVGSLMALASLYIALLSATGRREAVLWTALAIPALVFMPNSGGSILGMGYRSWHPAAFALLAIVSASRHPSARRPEFPAIVAGAFAALAALCRTEWGIATLVSVIATQATRTRLRKPLLGEAAAAALTFFSIVGGVLLVFVFAAGGNAVFADGHLLLTHVPEETRTFLWKFSQIAEWRRGLLELSYSAACWIGTLLLLQMVAIAKADRAKALRKTPLLLSVLFLLVFCAAQGGAGGAVPFSAAPLVCAAAVGIGLFGRAERSEALVGFGLAGLLFFHRRPFHIVDGAYVAPPLLFAFVSAAAIVQWLLDRETISRARERFRLLCSEGVLLLIVCAFVSRAAQYREDDRVPIPGTAGMLSARPSLASGLSALAALVQKESTADEGLVVFPEGAVVNYLASRSNPIRHKLYIPGYLTLENESEVLHELTTSPPKIIVVLERPTPEYGQVIFGVDYGKRVQRWIEHRYQVRPLDPSKTRGSLRSWSVLAVRKDDG